MYGSDEVKLIYKLNSTAELLVDLLLVQETKETRLRDCSKLNLLTPSKI